MSVIKVNLASKMYPLPRRWIHGTTVPETLGKLSHQRCIITVICERMHQSGGNVLRTLIHGKQLQNINTIHSYIDKALSIAMYTMRAELHHTVGNCPGNLIFNRDMFLNMPLIAGCHAITQKREHLINENLLRENQKRRHFNYAPNQKILKKRWNPNKLASNERQRCDERWRRDYCLTGDWTTKWKCLSRWCYFHNQKLKVSMFGIE